jgi:hypothetical protein
MKRLFILFFTLCLLQMLSSCKTRSTAGEEQMPVVSVKVTPVIQGDIENEISFNGSTVYLKKNLVISPIAGYIVKVNVRFGQEINKGDVLFEVQTRESKALESGERTTGDYGTVKITAASDGFINDLNISEAGGYVAEGGSLCTIVNNRDLMVKVNVPFEYNNILARERICKIRLADNTSIRGSVFRILPVMDEINQTQTVLIKPETARQLPENLNLLIIFISERHRQALLVSKSSLMTNETQSEFWVMKIGSNNLAVKIPVKKGIENDTLAEIISPALNLRDLIISEGAYGLPDSTTIRIAK